MPARNWARPPNMAANGASASGDFGVPHQPARFEATMKVAPANPARPRIYGAAIGCRNTRAGKPSCSPATLASAVRLLSSSELIIHSSRRKYLVVRGTTMRWVQTSIEAACPEQTSFFDEVCVVGRAHEV